MSEIHYVTTSGRYGLQAGHATAINDPVPPNLEEGWTFSMAGSAAADGLIFWFWRCEKLDPVPPEIVHAVDHVYDEMKAVCGAGPLREWPPDHKWSDDCTKVTCPKCLENADVFTASKSVPE